MPGAGAGRAVGRARRLPRRRAFFPRTRPRDCWGWRLRCSRTCRRSSCCETGPSTGRYSMSTWHIRPRPCVRSARSFFRRCSPLPPHNFSLCWYGSPCSRSTLVGTSTPPHWHNSSPRRRRRTKRHHTTRAASPTPPPVPAPPPPPVSTSRVRRLAAAGSGGKVGYSRLSSCTRSFCKGTRSRRQGSARGRRRWSRPPPTTPPSPCARLPHSTPSAAPPPSPSALSPAPLPIWAPLSTKPPPSPARGHRLLTHRLPPTRHGEGACCGHGLPGCSPHPCRPPHARPPPPRSLHTHLYTHLHTRLHSSSNGAPSWHRRRCCGSCA
mmetsp:Transcript_35350/g.112543  ORF Transcript_35350/g.112543 Transcript_35350/m.112543 type:complete len:323 (-) Transcript_35350:714-1682(-)